MYNPLSAGKRGRLFSQEHHGGITGGHSPRQLVPRFLPGLTRRFVTRILPGLCTRFSTRFVPRFSGQIYPGFSPGFHPEMVRRFSPRFLPRMVPRLLRRHLPRMVPRLLPLYLPRMVRRLLRRHLHRMVPQNLRQDSSPLLSPVFRPAHAQALAAPYWNLRTGHCRLAPPGASLRLDIPAPIGTLRLMVNPEPRPPLTDMELSNVSPKLPDLTRHESRVSY
jgi:hypothetical protein